MSRILVFDTDLYLGVWDTVADFLTFWEPNMWDEIVLIVDEGGNRYRAIPSEGTLHVVPDGARMGRSALAYLIRHHLVAFMHAAPDPEAPIRVLIDQVQTSR